MALQAAGSHYCGDLFSGEHEAEFARLMQISDNLPEGEIVGAVMQFQTADSYAVYVVVDDAPLTVQHVDVFDGWQIDKMMIKGMDRQDVLDHLARRKSLNALFANR